MNPLPYIEKWISEHGSAAALREHVALLKTQMEDMKAKKADSDSRADKAERRQAKADHRADKAEASIEKLETQLDDARQQIERLKNPGIPIPNRHITGILSRKKSRCVEG